MCVAQFREYCEVFSHKLQNGITRKDIVQIDRAPYKGIQGALYYTCDKEKLKRLAESGNEYARMDLGEFNL